MKLSEEEKSKLFKQIKITQQPPSKEGGQQVCCLAFTPQPVTATLEALGITVICDTYRTALGNKELCMLAMSKLLSEIDEGMTK